MEKLARFKGTAIEVRPDSNSTSISGDRQKIEYVLSNLLSNAVKFTLQGSITVSLKEINNQAQISVEDTGAGIPPEDLPHIFEPFYQAKGNGALKGAGIGLTVARTWVEAHGGKIWAESKGKGKGTMVTFTLPI